MILLTIEVAPAVSAAYPDGSTGRYTSRRTALHSTQEAFLRSLRLL